MRRARKCLSRTISDFAIQKTTGTALKHGEIPEKGISFPDEKEALPFRRTVVDSDKL